MEIKGKITIFPEAKEVEGKTKIFCRGTLSSKGEDGKYINKSVSIRFAGKQFPEEKVNQLKTEECYSLEIEEGFLAVDSFVINGKERRELSIVVLSGKLKGHKPVAKREEVVDEDLPF